MDEPNERGKNSNVNQSPQYNRISIVDDFGGSSSPNPQSSHYHSITSGPINIDLSHINTTPTGLSNNEIGPGGTSTKTKKLRRTKNERGAKTNNKNGSL